MAKDSRTRLPRGILGMLVLVTMVEITLARHPLRFTETATLSWRLAAEAIPREARRLEVACLGDSLVKIGVVPAVIEAGTGQTTYNFGMAQAPAPATYFLFRRLLEAGGRPSSIVVDFKPSVLTGGPRLSIRHWQDFLTVREAVELAREVGDLSFLLDMLRGQILPSARYRLVIREAIGASWLGQVSSTYQTNRLADRNWRINRGAHLNSSTVGFSGEIAADQYAKLRSDDWRCHRINAIYVERLIALAESRKIPVYWLIPPLPPVLQSRRERSGVDAAYVGFVREFQARHPGLSVVDGRGSGYQNPEFADQTHLNGRGSIAMSRDLAAILADRSREPSRWVSLPGYRDGPTNVRLEEIDQSRIAIEAQPAISR